VAYGFAYIIILSRRVAFDMAEIACCNCATMNNTECKNTQDQEHGCFIQLKHVCFILPRKALLACAV
jgi:hypothetical protein